MFGLKKKRFNGQEPSSVFDSGYLVEETAFFYG